MAFRRRIPLIHAKTRGILISQGTIQWMRKELDFGTTLPLSEFQISFIWYAREAGSEVNVEQTRIVKVIKLNAYLRAHQIYHNGCISTRDCWSLLTYPWSETTFGNFILPFAIHAHRSVFANKLKVWIASEVKIAIKSTTIICMEYELDFTRAI
jgi:hypothetical protein